MINVTSEVHLDEQFSMSMSYMNRHR